MSWQAFCPPGTEHQMELGVEAGDEEQPLSNEGILAVGQVAQVVPFPCLESFKPSWTKP